MGAVPLSEGARHRPATTVCMLKVSKYTVCIQIGAQAHNANGYRRSTYDTYNCSIQGLVTTEYTRVTAVVVTGLYDGIVRTSIMHSSTRYTTTTELYVPSRTE